MNNVRRQSGFTLIELMIVIAILAILVAIALPAYQNYSVRAKASECVSVAASPKLAIAETWQSNGGGTNWPSSFGAAGYSPEASQYCNEASYGTNGSFTVQTRSIGASNFTYTFTPSAGSNDSRIEWTCSTDSSNPAHVPAECR